VRPFLTAWAGSGDAEPDTGCRCRVAWRGSGPRRWSEPPIEAWAVSHTKGIGLSPEASGTLRRWTSPTPARTCGLASPPPSSPPGTSPCCRLRRPSCRASCRGTTAAPPAASRHHQPALRAATSHHPGRPTSSPRGTRPSGNNGMESHDKPDSLLRKSPLWLPTWCLTRQYVSNAARSCNPEREVWPVGLSNDPHHVWLAVALRG